MAQDESLIASIRAVHDAGELRKDITQPSQDTSRFKLVIVLWCIIGGVVGLVLAFMRHLL